MISTFGSRTDTFEYFEPGWLAVETRFLGTPGSEVSINYDYDAAVNRTQRSDGTVGGYVTAISGEESGLGADLGLDLAWFGIQQSDTVGARFSEEPRQRNPERPSPTPCADASLSDGLDHPQDPKLLHNRRVNTIADRLLGAVYGERTYDDAWPRRWPQPVPPTLHPPPPHPRAKTAQ